LRLREGRARSMDLNTTGLGWSLFATTLLVALNGLFVAAEFALVKVRPARIRAMAEHGSRRGKRLHAILERLDLYLSSCQLGVTLSSLLLGWLAEPAVATGLLWLGRAAGISIETSLLHGIALVLALTLVTIVHMTIGEQAPKIWSIHRSESTALALSFPLVVFTGLFRPLIALINWLSNRSVRVVGVDPDAIEEAPPDVEELASLLKRSADAGHLTPRQEAYAKNIMEFVDLEVRHILVPRSDVVYLSQEAPPEENLRYIRESGHSRFPLCEDDLDSVIGIVHAKRVLLTLLDGVVRDLKELAQPAVFVPDSQPLSRLIHELQQARSGCAVVVDEYGTTIGMVFLDDALEEIVGPMYDEFDAPAEVEKEIQEVEEGVWNVAGGLALPDAEDLLAVDDLGEEDTLGGYVTARLGRLPKTGEALQVGAFMVRVTEVGEHRVKRLRVERLPPEEPTDGADN